MLASWAKSALLGPIPSPPNSMRRQVDPTRSATVYPRGLRSSHLQVGPDRQDRLFPPPRVDSVRTEREAGATTSARARFPQTERNQPRTRLL